MFLHNDPCSATSPNSAQYWVHSRCLIKVDPEPRTWFTETRDYLPGRTTLNLTPVLLWVVTLACLLASGSHCPARQPPSPAVGGFHRTLLGCPRQTLLKHIITAQAEGYLHSAIDVSVTAPAAASITLQRRSIIQSQRAGTVTIKSAGTIEGP